MGGGYSNCSMLEAISLCQEITGNEFNCNFVQENRRGDHIWWISDLMRFQNHYLDWKINFDVPQILQQIFELNVDRWGAPCAI